MKFYIKPQQPQVGATLAVGCILLKFYIKPQQRWQTRRGQFVVSYWNSTSNHNSGIIFIVNSRVVSYWNSTSNHNKIPFVTIVIYVVSYWNSTSNHNIWVYVCKWIALYLIEILHQTTTFEGYSWFIILLYLIEILHQTTTDI